MKSSRLPFVLVGGFLVVAFYLAWPDQTGEPEASDRELLQVSETQVSHESRLSRRGRFDEAETAVTKSAASLTDSLPSSESTRSTPQQALARRIARVTSKKEGSESSRKRATFSELLMNQQGLAAPQRVRELERLRQPNSLSAQERELAQAALFSGASDSNTSPDSWPWLVDELMTNLRVDGADNAALSHRLAELVDDSTQESIVRDYALQHLGHLREEGGDTSVIDSVLRGATAERSGTLAGTALLALNRYGEEEDLGGDALAVAEDSTYDLRSRLTALQVAGKQDNHEALPFAVSIAGDSAQPVPLRMSAIATIGDLQAREHASLLQQLSQSNDERLRTAALASLNKFLP